MISGCIWLPGPARPLPHSGQDIPERKRGASSPGSPKLRAEPNNPVPILKALPPGSSALALLPTTGNSEATRACASDRWPELSASRLHNALPQPPSALACCLSCGPEADLGAACASRRPNLFKARVCQPSQLPQPLPAWGGHKLHLRHAQSHDLDGSGA